MVSVLGAEKLSLVETDAEGRKRRGCKQWRAPSEELRPLDRPQRFPRPGLSIRALKRVAASMSATEAGRRASSQYPSLADFAP